MNNERANALLSYDYVLGKKPMRCVNKVKYLGINFDPHLTFQDHTRETIDASYRRLGFIMRFARLFSNPMSSRLLYNALVRSKSECNALVWNPLEKWYILMVEKVHKAFLRNVFKKGYEYYPFMFLTRLIFGMLGYNSLLLRRNLTLLRIVFQLMKGAISCPTFLDRIGLNMPINFLRGRHHVAVPASRTNLYRTAPFPRAIRYINGIILEVLKCDVFHMKEGRLSEIASSYLLRLH
jgi:hypothetical protein